MHRFEMLVKEEPCEKVTLNVVIKMYKIERVTKIKSDPVRKVKQL